MPVFRPKIDYSLRPAKATVRHMVVEALTRLGSLESLENYRYVGMGSIFFRDFEIIHRRLGIKKMKTIEGNPRAADRVDFNLPLDCIEPVMQTTGNALPQIQLEDYPHILWLDYESRVNSPVLSDIEEVIGRCAVRSVLIVTVNADRLVEDQRARWLSDLGYNRPKPYQPRTKSDYALLSYRVIRAAIDQTIGMRNAALPNLRQVEFRQIFHTVHADNAQMVTVGGVLIGLRDRRQWNSCGIESLDFVRSDDTALRVRVPILTRREVHHLLRQMPDELGNLGVAATTVGIPAKDAREFASIYRHAPLFIEADKW